MTIQLLIDDHRQYGLPEKLQNRCLVFVDCNDGQMTNSSEFTWSNFPSVVNLIEFIMIDELETRNERRTRSMVGFR